MHPIMLAEYRRLFAPMNFTGSVLEVGATPDDKSLLAIPELGRASERIGVNLDGPHDYGGFHIAKGNANALPFGDNRFDLVLCNAVIEHDPYFWKTIAEIHRVAKPGGTVVTGAPGYRRTAFEKVQGKLKRWLPARLHNPWLTATIVFQVHNEPGDFYRFSEQAFREVIMGGLDDVQVSSVLMPPRLIGVGRKAHAAP